MVTLPRASVLFVDQREPHNDGHLVRFGLSAVGQKTLGVDRVEVFCPANDSPVEIGQSIEIMRRHEVYTESWGNRVAKILPADHQIIPFEPISSPKIQGLESSTCKSLEIHFDAEYVERITTEPSLLDRTKFSPETRKVIVAACRAEVKARKKDGDAAPTIALMRRAGVRPDKARYLGRKLNPDFGPFQFLADGEMTFLEVERFTALYDPKTAKADRPLAAILNSFLRTDDVLLDRLEILKNAWLDHHIDQKTGDAALERLVTSGALRQIDSNRRRNGFDIRETFYGLSRIVKNEEAIADVIENNEEFTLSSEHREIIAYVIDNAAVLLGRPGFVLNAKQKQAIWNAFKYKVSAICGMPGSGKTAITALINLIASILFGDMDYPAYGMALAGRAASQLRAATMCRHDGRSYAMEASTIHSALKMRGDGNAFHARGTLDAGVLILDEMSMNSSPLLAEVLRVSTYRRLVFVGDPDQLPPIGAGKPFADIIRTGACPITSLDQNYRTDCVGIRKFADLVRCGCPDELQLEFEDCLTAGGADFKTSEGEKSYFTAQVFATVSETMSSLHEIAVLTPHNQTDSGTWATNLNIRLALGFAVDRIVKGDLLIITDNNYKAPSSLDEEQTEAIFNGERALVTSVGSDYLDLEFEPNPHGEIRRVRLLMKDADAGTLEGQLPTGVQFGYALTTHKAQGSQFHTVIVVTARPARKGVVQRSNLYTAITRPRWHLIILGSLDEFIDTVAQPDKSRRTLLEKILA